MSFAAPSFDQAVADMQRQGTQIIFDTMDDGANRKLCDAMARRQFTVKAKVSTIVSMGDSVGNDYNDTCRNSVYIPGDSIPYTTTSVPGVAEFRAGLRQVPARAGVHQWALEAWGLGNMVADGVEGMGPAPTRKGLEDFLDGLRKYTANGLLTGLDYQSRPTTSKPTAEDCFTIARWLDAEERLGRSHRQVPVLLPRRQAVHRPALEQGN